MHSLYYERAASFGGTNSSSMPPLPPTTDSSDTLAQRAIDDRDRYSRQVLFSGIGPHGQDALARSHVAIAGCGATGAATASLLARAGVGTLTIVDRDFVEPSNL